MLYPNIVSKPTALHTALALAERGLYVCHIYPASKVPGPGNGFDGATNAPDVLEIWFANCPGAGVGLNLRKSGLIAVDVDPRHGGIDSIRQIIAEHGPLPHTVRTASGRGDGGGHVIFTAPAGTPAHRLCGDASPWPGIDVLAAGGSILPPSLHADTRKPYRWIHPPDSTPFADAPDWLVQPLLDHERRQSEARERAERKRATRGGSMFDQLRNALPVEDVIGRFTNLSGNGRTLTGKCPLHGEVNGEALVVWPELGAWKCYGKCAQGGDVIRFWRLARERGLA